jgi:hypothetical protein
MWDQTEQALRASMERVTTKIATLLPGILAFIAALLIFVALGWLFALLVRRVLAAVHFDERIRRGANAMAEWSSEHTPTMLAGRIVFWSFVVLGLLVGASAFEAASAETVLSGYVFGYVPRIVEAVLLLFVGNLVARFLSRSALIAAVNLNLHYARLLAMGVKWLVLLFTAALALDYLTVGQQIVDLAFGILFGGIVLALALAIGLGSRDLVSRSLAREAARPSELPQQERLHHF